MSKISLYDERFESTFEMVSRDDSRKESMIESDVSIIDFDKIKEAYAEGLQLDKPASNDGYIEVGQDFYFIEFKNGNLRGERHSLVKKIYDSLLIYSDITENPISYTKVYGNYILVYNYDNNMEEIEKEIRDRQNKNKNQLERGEIQESGEFDNFARAIARVAKDPMDLLKLKLRFENFCFKTVKTYDIEQFQELFMKRILNKETK